MRWAAFWAAEEFFEQRGRLEVGAKEVSSKGRVGWAKWATMWVAGHRVINWERVELATVVGVWAGAARKEVHASNGLSDCREPVAFG
jgi:hypothetical protein